VLGFEPVLGGVLIQPSRYQIFETMSLRIKYLNHNVLLKYIGKPTKSTSNREFKVNGLSYQGQYNSTMQMHTLLISDETIQSLEKEIIIEVKDM
jgi:hypothetical protein